MTDRSEDEEDAADAETSFRLSNADLAIFKRLAANLRSQLVKAEPSFIRSAAPAILAVDECHSHGWRAGAVRIQNAKSRW